MDSLNSLGEFWSTLRVLVERGNDGGIFSSFPRWSVGMHTFLETTAINRVSLGSHAERGNQYITPRSSPVLNPV